MNPALEKYPDSSNAWLDTERESGNGTLFQNNYMEARIFPFLVQAC